MPPLLSIVVPVYNAQPYLVECLDSLVNQTLDPGAYEILLIDDKSTDDSLAVCEEYAKRHSTIRVFPLPENTPGGAGFPYNVGIKKAQGIYVGMVESDDFTHPEMFAELLAAAFRDDADMALCSFTMYYMDDNAMRPPYDIEYWAQIFEPGFAELAEIAQKEKYLKISPVPWRKLYRREFLYACNARFPVDGHSFEDMYFHWATVIPARSITQIDKRLITYRAQRKGQSTSMDAGKAAMHQIAHIRAIRKLLQDAKLYAAYYKTFLHLTADTLARVPTDHPMRGQVEEAIVALCDTMTGTLPASENRWQEWWIRG